MGEGRHDRRDEFVISAAFWLATLAAVGLAVLYWRGGQPQLEGLLLALGSGGLAVGMITWAHRLLPQGPEVEEREVFLASPEADRASFDADLGRGGQISRRRLILRSLGAAVVAFGAALLFPLRSLGPQPSDLELDSTPWARGKALVNADGVSVRASDVPVGGLVTVFPQGAVNSETGQAVLIRVNDPSLIRPLPGRESWTPQGLVAYSKVCTHAGCPVGLFEAASNQLLCPCHQSTFDVLHGATPIFGPAAARLPQLPLVVGLDGVVYATGGFSEPPGPSFWNRST
jgi:ubiquinol-cytochrome c reductase iron-sulfur subunit